jgi:hypothetical protein
MTLATHLVGKTVNIGDKDGGVYEGVTVSSFDESRGVLYLEGGMCGSAFGSEDELRPLDGLVPLHVHDVARGYVHE